MAKNIKSLAVIHYCELYELVNIIAVGGTSALVLTIAHVIVKNTVKRIKAKLASGSEESM